MQYKDKFHMVGMLESSLTALGIAGIALTHTSGGALTAARRAARAAAWGGHADRQGEKKKKKKFW